MYMFYYYRFLKEIDKKAKEKDKARIVAQAQKDQPSSKLSIGLYFMLWNTRINLDIYVKFNLWIVNQSREISNQHSLPAPAKVKVEKPNPLPQKSSPTPQARELPQNVNASKTNANATTVEETGTNQKLSLRELSCHVSYIQ